MRSTVWTFWTKPPRSAQARARAKREAALRAAQERIAAQRRAEEERRAKELARIAELRAENARREKKAAESAKQKGEKAARIAALQAEIGRRSKNLADSRMQKMEMACRHEQSWLDDLKAAGNDDAVRSDLKRLSGDLTCERLRPQVVAAIGKVDEAMKKSETPPPPENTPELIELAQKELARLGCFSGDQDGVLGPQTKIAIKKYKKRKEQPISDIAVTESFVKELGKQKLRVCPSVVVDRPEPHKATKKHTERDRSRRSRNRESRKKNQRSRQQAKSGRSGHAGMIGIGF